MLCHRVNYKWTLTLKMCVLHSKWLKMCSLNPQLTVTMFQDQSLSQQLASNWLMKLKWDEHSGWDQSDDNITSPLFLKKKHDISVTKNMMQKCINKENNDIFNSNLLYAVNKSTKCHICMYTFCIYNNMCIIIVFSLQWQVRAYH